jgi:hypothetical protein
MELFKDFMHLQWHHAGYYQQDHSVSVLEMNNDFIWRPLLVLMHSVSDVNFHDLLGSLSNELHIDLGKGSLEPNLCFILFFYNTL